MANHATVKIKKPLFSKEIIEEVLDDLNKNKFKNILRIEYSKEGKKHYWVLTVEEGDIYDVRELWLNSNKSFEIRHGGGSQFMWWVDTTIFNNLSKKFNGKWEDEGTGERKTSDKYETFKDYLEIRYNNSKHKEMWITEAMLDTPKIFRYKL